MMASSYTIPRADVSTSPRPSVTPFGRRHAGRPAHTHLVQRPVLYRVPDLGGPGTDAAPDRYQRLDHYLRDPQETPQGRLQGRSRSPGADRYDQPGARPPRDPEAAPKGDSRCAPLGVCPQYGLAACDGRHERRQHPGRPSPVPEGLAAWLRHPCAVERRPAEYGVEVDGARQAGNHGDLLQRRRRGATEHRGKDVDAVIRLTIRQEKENHAPCGQRSGMHAPVCTATAPSSVGVRGGADRTALCLVCDGRVRRRILCQAAAGDTPACVPSVRVMHVAFGARSCYSMGSSQHSRTSLRIVWPREPFFPRASWGCHGWHGPRRNLPCTFFLGISRSPSQSRTCVHCSRPMVWSIASPS